MNFKWFISGVRIASCDGKSYNHCEVWTINLPALISYLPSRNGLQRRYGVRHRKTPSQQKPRAFHAQKPDWVCPRILPRMPEGRNMNHRTIRLKAHQRHILSPDSLRSLQGKVVDMISMEFLSLKPSASFSGFVPVLALLGSSVDNDEQRSSDTDRA